MASKEIAHLITMDRPISDWITQALTTIPISCTTWPSLEIFEDKASVGERGCILLDTRLAGPDGIGGLIKSAKHWMPVILLCNSGDVRTAVDAMKLGASDVAERTMSPDVLAMKILNSFHIDLIRREEIGLHRDISDRVARLTDREREIALLLSEGLSNKQISFRLSISIHTVANHRVSLNTKLQTQNTAELVCTVMTSGCPQTLRAIPGSLRVLPPCLCPSKANKIAA